MDLLELVKTYLDIDLDFLTWLLWLWWPSLLIVLILPTFIIALLYVNACIAHVYRIRHYLNFSDVLSTKDFYDKAQAAIAILWECHGWIWHGYEIDGYDKIPKDRGALIVYYHGVLPIDYYYLNCRHYIVTKRFMRSIVAEFLFKVPGYKLLMDVLTATPGTVQQIADMLLNGEIVAVAPGGIREGSFSSEYYELVWNNRIGFAKAACLGKAPIIPVFCRNVREAYRTAPFFRGVFRWIYEKTKLPLSPIYGGFPVKLRQYIGDPIPYDPNASPEEVAEKTAQAMRELIKKHQRIPGSIVRGLLERFEYFDKK